MIENRRYSVELGDVFRRHGPSYFEQNQLESEQYKVAHAIMNCRTEMLGGHVLQCDQCHKLHIAYNSCRNRHCPKCQTLRSYQWLQRRREELLPVQYFHVVFTLPHELNRLSMYNKKALYQLLFTATWETIRTLGEDPKRLGGQMGMLAILHTWGQNLSLHNHLHCIIPAGALIDKKSWKHSKKGFLFPVKVMSKLFRRIFITALKTMNEAGELCIPEGEDINALLDNLMEKDWVVYCKKPFAGPEKVLDYLGRYTHKIAIANHRILSCDEQGVTFKWRDYADNNQEKIMTLSPHEFIRRFLLHVVPKGFMRIRSFGFLASACKAKNVAIIRQILDYQPKTEDEEVNTKNLMLKLTGIDIDVCPYCQKGQLYLIEIIPSKLEDKGFDTS